MDTDKLAARAIESVVDDRLTGVDAAAEDAERVTGAGEGIDTFRQIAAKAANAEFRSALETAAQSALDEVEYLDVTDNDNWQDQVLEVLRGKITQITRVTNLQLGRAMKQAADEVISSTKPELEAAIKNVAPRLVRVVDKYAP